MFYIKDKIVSKVVDGGSAAIAIADNGLENVIEAELIQRPVLRRKKVLQS